MLASSEAVAHGDAAYHIRRMAEANRQAKAARRAHIEAQGDLFGSATALPAGFAYRDDVVTAAEEQALVDSFAGLPFKPFEFHGYLGRRRVVSFGWRYDYGERRVQRSTPIPDFLQKVRARAADFAGQSVDRLEQVSVIEYAPGAGIGWHRDKPEFDDIIAISLLAPCTLRFRRPAGTGWDRARLTVAPRSAYLLRGPARLQWYHGIPPLRSLRYSITLRSLVAKTP